MQTSRLKTFAIQARNILKEGVLNRISSLGFDRNGRATQEPLLVAGGAVFMGETHSEDFYRKWKKLQERIESHSLREVVEEAAYTWFNRLLAIRILQMNGIIEPVLKYQSDNIRRPVIIAKAMRGDFPMMSDYDRNRLDDLLNNPQRTAEQFALLITAFCHNTPIIDRCFGAIEDYTELLLPTNILAENGFIDMLNNTPFISDDDYKSPELIGWLYQFYISERKDEVFAKSGKYDPDEIPAATQIFTPNWIVKYMVQNTVGRIYLDNNPQEKHIAENWKYLVEPAESENYAMRTLKIEDITKLKVADLACGSGHILNECFDLLLELYVNEGYSQRQAVDCILRYNLTGIDIDTRAKQLATFALLLKACQKSEIFADAHTMPRIYDMRNVIPPHYTSLRETLPHFFLGGSQQTIDETMAAFKLMENAETLGSIMKFDISPETRKAIAESMERWQNDGHEDFDGLFAGMRIILALTEEYSVLVMNPPYMGSGRFDATLSKYVRDNYEEGKADLFSVFMQVAIDRLAENGKYGMINMHAWMFLYSFENLRKKLLEEETIDSLLHLGAHTFDELAGEVVQNAAYIITKQLPNFSRHFSVPHDPNIPSCYAICRQSGIYFRLVDGRDCADKERMFLEAKKNKTPNIYYPEVHQANFENIPGSPIGYWAKQAILDVFEHNDLISKHAITRAGFSTGKNSVFVRNWFEVQYPKIGFGLKNNDEFISSEFKYVPFTAGGTFRKWYGNLDSIVDWTKTEQMHRPRTTYMNLYYKPAITWNAISSNSLSCRFYGQGLLFEHAAATLFAKESNKRNIFLAFLNSKVSQYILNILNPTLNSGSDLIASLPLVKPKDENRVIRIVNQNIDISKADWDIRETSWDFKRNELIEMQSWCGGNVADLDMLDPEEAEELKDSCPTNASLIEHCIWAYHNKWERNFDTLHSNEEELNRQFIEIYGLQDELEPFVPTREITILQQGEITILPAPGDDSGYADGIRWNDDVIIKQFISYAIGCMMGRYRLDKPGLHIAHPNAAADEKAPYEYCGQQFVIDDDAIIPLMSSDCSFNDNAVHRFTDFVRIVFGEKTLVQNLNYIEAALGKPLEQYFIKDFWKDHKKMYQNRPIYWLFSSSKGAFQCIVYMHRMDAYTVEMVRQKYLLPHIEDLRARITALAERGASLTTQELRKLDTLSKQLKECEDYHEQLHPVADKNIAFDLDDGIVVNHAKFGSILAKLR